MNIIDAIKSGKPFKRPSWSDYLEFSGSIFKDSSALNEKEDFLATDYFLKEQKLELTKEQVEKAYEAATADLMGDYDHPAARKYGQVARINILLKELGFE